MKATFNATAIAVLLIAFVSVVYTQTGACPGVCQPDTYSCSSPYQSGLCPGASNIKCCPESTPNCPGQCQINTLSCAGSYESGLCPGSSSIQCCLTGGQYGIDVSDATSVSDFNCFLSRGFNYTIVRAFRSNGVVDTNAPQTIKNAWQAGMARVDVYMFPCPTCSASGSDQVKTTVDYLSSNGAQYNAYWFDIEGTQYWSSDKTTNQNFFNSMAKEAESLSLTIGVYTSSSQWDPIMGSTFTGGSKYPLWYAHYDATPSFNDFEPFAGWTKPAIKQYSGDDNDCNSNYDKDWSETINYT